MTDLKKPEHHELLSEANRAFAWARALDALRRDQWGNGGEGAMTKLARSFPTLRHADGVEPWDVARFVRWSDGPQLTSGMVYALRFVLQVWNPDTDWATHAVELGVDGSHLKPFNVVAAFSCWDEAHRAAFFAWVAAPFHP